MPTITSRTAPRSSTRIGAEGRAADRLPSRLAAQRRRLGQPDDVLPRQGLSASIAHDRRGHGRSTQTDTGNEMDTYAADVAALAEHLDLKDAVHVGHSTGGGEVARYVARMASGGRVAKAVLIGAVPPVMVKSDKQSRRPADRGVRRLPRRRWPPTAPSSTATSPAGPFYGFNRPGAKVSQGVIDNWWRQGMMGGAKAHYDCIKAFSETDFTEDLKKIDVPVLVMHGDDDQIVPDRRFRAAVGQAAEERHAQDLPGLPARHVHDACRSHQPGPAGLHQGLIRRAIQERPASANWSSSPDR